MASAEDIAAQLERLKAHRFNVQHYLKQLAIHTPAHVQPSVIHGLKNARDEIATIKRTLRDWGQVVEDLPDDEEHQARPAKNTTGTGSLVNNGLTVTMPQIRTFIVQHYNDSELRDLCFELGIDYENLPGGGKADKARELVAHCNRRGRLAELVELCRSQRPTAPWS